MAQDRDSGFRREVLNGAERLHERLDRLPSPSAAATTHEAASAPDRVLEPWARAFAAGDLAALQRRLSWDGITAGAAAAALSAPTGAHDVDGGWLAELSRYAILGEDLRALAATTPPAARADIPFAELWWPWVTAITEAAWRAGAAARELPPAARDALAYDLWRDIADLSALAALEAYSPFREAGEGYDAFVADLLRDGLAGFYNSYPALLRRTATLLQTWRDGVEELAERLRADRADLAVAFGLAGPPGPLAMAKRLDADRHHGGRGLYRLTFANGWEVVYKPRALDLEDCFARVSAWALERGLHCAPPAAHVLPKTGYGWMEYVASAALEAADAAATAAYFERAGALVAFAQALGAADLHAENVIASARGPVVVDWEMLLQPVPAGAAAIDRVAASLDSALQPLSLGEWGAGSCLDAGLLARPGAEAAQAAYPGLEPVAPRRLTERARRWRDLGADSIAVGPADLFAPPRENALVVGGVPETPARNAPALLAGYTAGYRFLAAHRGELARLLDGFAGARTRVLARPSQEYANLLGMLGLPRLQRRGHSAGYLIEASLRRFAMATERPHLWPLAAVERHALEDLDVPRFEIPVDARDLTLPGAAAIPGFTARSGIEMARARLGAMGEEHLAGQIAVLRDALECGPAARARQAWRESPVRGAGYDPARDCRDEGLALARELVGEAVSEPEGTESDSLATRGVYEGTAGRALWLAACAAASRDPLFLGALDSALRPLARSLGRWEREGVPEPVRIGALNGIGGLVWALVWIGKLAPSALVRDPRHPRHPDGAARDERRSDREIGVPAKPLDLARRAAALLTPARLGADRALDFEGGAAGAILGLLALYEATGDGDWLERAMIAGRTLVTAQEPALSGGAAWRSPRGSQESPVVGPILAGFAHGAAGIARALGALAGFSDEPRLLQAIDAAHTFERGIWHAEQGNWPVVNASGRATTWMTAWCHGAPGIALGRAFEPALLRDGEAQAEIERAVATTLAAGLGSDDHLCCGAAGRIGVLAAVGRRLERPEWVAAAARLGVELLARGRERGFRLPTARDAARARRGIFRGLPGISLQMVAVGADLPPFVALPLPSEFPWPPAV